ncbi:MAG TPA: hypothetical protein ENI27_07595 [bacterium]|nr:hypothetical protein [bacterium]
MSEANLMNTAAVHQGRTLQQVKTGYVTAVSVQKPRDLKDVRRKLEEEAAVGGVLMYYGWGAGKNHIEGPSIHFAMSAMRAWGNCAVEMEPVQDMGDAWIFTSVFIDVESGTTLKRQFRQSKTSIVYGNHDEERKADIRFQIGQSKAARNVVLNAFPKGLVQHAMEAAKNSVREELKKWVAAKDKAGKKGDGMVWLQYRTMELLIQAGVTKERVLSKVSRSTVAGLTLDDIIILKGDIAAIQDGVERAEELFPSTEQEKDSGEELMEHLSDDEAPGKSGDSTSDGGDQPEKPENEPPAAGESKSAPTPQAEEKAEEEPAFGKQTIKKMETGDYGGEVMSAALELKAKFKMIDDDPMAIERVAIDWDWIEKGAGAEGKALIEQAFEYYRGLVADKLGG